MGGRQTDEFAGLSRQVPLQLLALLFTGPKVKRFQISPFPSTLESYEFYFRRQKAKSMSLLQHSSHYQFSSLHYRSKPNLSRTIPYPIHTERDKFVLASQSKQQNNIMASTIIYSILWLLLLVFIAWPISWFCAWWWVVLISFESLFPVIKSASEFLEKIVSWPRSVGSAMIKGDTQFPAPW